MPQTSLDGRCCAAEAIKAVAPDTGHVNHDLGTQTEKYLVVSKSWDGRETPDSHS